MLPRPITNDDLDPRRNAHGTDPSTIPLRIATDARKANVADGGSASKASDNAVNTTNQVLTPEEVIGVLKTAGVMLFRDELNNAYAHIPCDVPRRHRETCRLSIKNKTCCRRMRQLVQAEKGWILPRLCLREAIDLMEAEADIADRNFTLANRVCEYEGGVLIDRADSAWGSIFVDSNGWRLLDVDTPRFRRHAHQAPLPEPASGEQIQTLFQFVPVSDPQDQLLLLSWLVSALNPKVTSPILAPTGQPGSGKSTRTKMLRSLIDPSVIDMCGEAERSNLHQVMHHHAVPCFDNLGSFNRLTADFFCRTVTGAGYEGRQLYTDLDEVLLKFKRPIILNSISLPTTRADFLDRCVVLRVERLNEFRPQNVVEEEFRQVYPELFGALLELLAKTLQQLPATPSPTEFRLADFARLGRAVARSLGKSDDDFDKAYRANIDCHAKEALDDDPFLNALVGFFESTRKDPFTGTTSELLTAVARFARTNKLPCTGRDWPGNARWVTTKLKELAPLLSTVGIRVEWLPRTNVSRPLRVSAVAPTDAPTIACAAEIAAPPNAEEFAALESIRAIREAK